MTWGEDWGGSIRGRPVASDGGNTERPEFEHPKFEEPKSERPEFEQVRDRREPPREAKALIKEYVENRGTDDRIRTSEFSRGTEIGQIGRAHV